MGLDRHRRCALHPALEQSLSPRRVLYVVVCYGCVFRGYHDPEVCVSLYSKRTKMKYILTDGRIVRVDEWRADADLRCTFFHRQGFQLGNG